METYKLELTPSEMRLIHELLFFMPPSVLDEARKQVIDGPEGDMKREYRWGDFLRRDAREVYASLVTKLDVTRQAVQTIMERRKVNESVR